jgi:hypothetical protein
MSKNISYAAYVLRGMDSKMGSKPEQITAPMVSRAAPGDNRHGPGIKARTQKNEACIGQGWKREVA